MRQWPVIPLLLALAPLTARAADDPPGAVTYTEHIAPLLYANCASCHRPDQVAPFPLLTYADARKHARTMLQVMQDRYMPPWQPEPGHGSFRNERRLTDAQIALVDKWVQAGMPEGDPAKLPPLPKFPEGWQIGQPDLIVKMDQAFDVPAAGPDIYRNFVIPLGLAEDKWVTAVEFRASAPEVVHHVLYHLDSTGNARAQAGKDGQPGFPGLGFRPTGSLGGWAVGGIPVLLPDGLAYPLPKGSDLVLQTHLHLSGKPVKEQLTVGLYFAERAPKRTLVPLPMPPAFGLFANIDIPAGQAGFTVENSFTLPVDVDIVSVSSHAHYLGKTMKAWAVLPDKTEKSLYSIRDWDFAWQGQYLYKDYVRLPKGTVIHAELTWDNSATNPRNPRNPPVRIHWGEETTDEMGQVTFLMLAAQQAETGRLGKEVKLHREVAFVQAWRRGYPVDWKRVGIEPPLIWRTTPHSQEVVLKTEMPLAIRDVDGKEHKPLQVEGAKAHVLFFITNDCPISNSYAPEINALVKDYADRPVRFYAVHVDSQLTPEAARKHAGEFGLKLPILLDTKHQLVRATQVTRTPEVAVVLPDGTVAYRGRIDDLYTGLGKKRQTPSQRDLRDALTAILAGDKVAVPRTESVGCYIPDLPASGR